MFALVLFLSGFGYLIPVLSARVTEPRECYNRFEYEYRVIQQLIELRKDIDVEKSANSKLILQVKDTQQMIEELTTKLSVMDASRDGSTYTRWGRTVCPDGATLVYEGFVAGGHHTHQGSGVNYLCMPNDPDWDQYIDGFQTADYLYGTEYHTTDYSAWKYLHGHDVPCAVCRIPRNDVLMIPGRNQCYDNYKLEYSGYLMAEYYPHKASSDYVCVDSKPESIQAGHEYKAESFMFFVQSTCGVIKCPPYANGRELTCAVCSFTPSPTV